MSTKIPVKRTLWNTSMQEQDPLLTRITLTQQQLDAIVREVTTQRARIERIPKSLRAPTIEERLAPIQAACVSLRIALKGMLGPEREQALRMASEALGEIEKAVNGERR